MIKEIITTYIKEIKIAFTDFKYSSCEFILGTVLLLLSHYLDLISLFIIGILLVFFSFYPTFFIELELRDRKKKKGGYSNGRKI